jgi:hypothetical protein
VILFLHGQHDVLRDAVTDPYLDADDPRRRRRERDAQLRRGPPGPIMEDSAAWELVDSSAVAYATACHDITIGG